MSNSTYLVSARKYRPLLFKEVVAQEHVTETLKNAIRLGRLAHAYMFTGPRGVGKTTAARIVAKAINCTTPPEDREDPSEPCRTCVSCQSFEEGRNMNIIEMDAASNNGVGDIRDLREIVRIPPQGNRMKVFIIDEVHMLSTSAFNALLKTLEEPPPHAMFIFATTEPHKVLPTIQSRCQRFDFRRIATSESVERLRLICKTEHIVVDEESLLLIARKGDGALRDALSVFDQAVSLCGTTITYPELIKALGVLSTDVYFSISQAILKRDSSAMIRTIDHIVRSGYDLLEFVDGLAEHLRNLFVAVTVEDPALLEATEADRKRFKVHGSEFSESTLLTLLHIAGEVAEALRMARQPRLRLEMALVRMANIPDSVDIRGALEKLDRLEKMAASGKITIESEVTRVLVSHKAEPGSPKKDPVPPKADPLPPKTEPVPPQSEAPSRPLPGAQHDEDSSEGPERLFENHPAHPPSPKSGEKERTAPPADDLSLFFEAPTLSRSKSRPESEAKMDDDADILVAEAGDEMDSDGEVQDGNDMEMLQKAWTTLIQEIMGTEKQLGSFLNSAGIFAFDKKTVFLGVPDDFHARAIRSERVKLIHRLNDLTGIRIEKIAFKIDASDANKDLTPDSEASVKESLDRLCENYPVVRSLVERFGGEIVW